MGEKGTRFVKSSGSDIKKLFSNAAWEVNKIFCQHMIKKINGRLVEYLKPLLAC